MSNKHTGQFDTVIELRASGASGNSCNVTEFLLAHCLGHCGCVVSQCSCSENDEQIYKEYDEIDFVYGFCNGKGRAAVVEYQQSYPLHRILHRRTFENIQRTLREARSFPPVNAECERQHGEDDVLAVCHSSKLEASRGSR